MIGGQRAVPHSQFLIHNKTKIRALESEAHMRDIARALIEVVRGHEMFCFPKAHSFTARFVPSNRHPSPPVRPIKVEVVILFRRPAIDHAELLRSVHSIANRKQSRERVGTRQCKHQTQPKNSRHGLPPELRRAVARTHYAQDPPPLPTVNRIPTWMGGADRPGGFVRECYSPPPLFSSPPRRQWREPDRDYFAFCERKKATRVVENSGLVNVVVWSAPSTTFNSVSPSSFLRSETRCFKRSPSFDP